MGIIENILLLFEIGWGTVHKIERLHSVAYRNVQTRENFIWDPNDLVEPPT